MQSPVARNEDRSTVLTSASTIRRVNCREQRTLTRIRSMCILEFFNGIGHLRPFMPQKTRVGNDRSQSTTDVARRRNRNEKLYKAGARSSVILAAQNADRWAAVSEIELALSTLSRRSDFSGADRQQI